MEQRTRKRSNKEITKKTYITIADKVSMGMRNRLRVQMDNKKADKRTMNRENNKWIRVGGHMIQSTKIFDEVHDGYLSMEKVQ
jgi:hypothetical protein